MLEETVKGEPVEETLVYLGLASAREIAQDKIEIEFHEYPGAN